MHTRLDRSIRGDRLRQRDDSRRAKRRRIAVRAEHLLLVALVSFSAACDPSAPPSTQESAATLGAGRPGPRATSPSGLPYSEDRAPCTNRATERQAFWGELHVHSSLSMDAWLWDVRNGPDEIFRFAMGEETLLPPLDAGGRPTRPARLERPLDFAALTDHASFQGEVALCTRPDSPRFDSDACRTFRAEKPIAPSPLGDFGVRMTVLSMALDARATLTQRNPELCGDGNGQTCRDSMKTVWEEQQAAAERHYDRSESCRFTTLHAYEYTATPGLAKVHHNVVFRNAALPVSPIAWVDEPDVYGLWQKLSEQCLEAGTGCDVLTLPHNSNLSNGNMFAITGQDLPLEEQRARARLRGDIERLAEISQIKGDSECRNGFAGVIGATDEFCDYEEWRGPEVEDCGPDGKGFGALMDQGCVSRKDYIRYALLEGFREQTRIGVNPFKIGFIAATDSHNANPGDVEEYSYDGWQGSPDALPEQRLDPGNSPVNATNSLASNPGGLAGVWAEENSRDSIFDAMKRRETFGTSGPRITARFFGGWEFPDDLCGSRDLVATGYAMGVPMGSDLPPRPAGSSASSGGPVDAPQFVVSAMRDVGATNHPGGLLQRAQIVKGWVDRDGGFHQEIFDVAGGPNGAGVDEKTCQPRGAGHNSLCSVWTDPTFDPGQNAVYYARVLENPSCRWSSIQCLEQAPGSRSPSCSDPEVDKTIQERLWTSPIWYEAGTTL